MKNNPGKKGFLKKNEEKEEKPISKISRSMTGYVLMKMIRLVMMRSDDRATAATPATPELIVHE
jgi:hypothetical protein